VVTQINVKAPFADYVLRPVTKSPSGTKQLPVVLRRGVNVSRLVNSL
jgi:hypothetical protein